MCSALRLELNDNGEGRVVVLVWSRTTLACDIFFALASATRAELKTRQSHIAIRLLLVVTRM